MEAKVVAKCSVRVASLSIRRGAQIVRTSCREKLTLFAALTLTSAIDTPTDRQMRHFLRTILHPCIFQERENIRRGPPLI